MTNIYTDLQLDRNLYLVTSLEKKEDGTVTMSAKEIQSYNEIFSESLLPGELYGNFSLKDGFLQSSNFLTGSAGWQLTPTSGELNFAVSVDSLDIPDTTTANSFHVDSNGNMWLGATTFAGSNAKVSNAGAATFNSITITGGSITIGSNASIDSSGNATFTSVTTLNMKSYTNFETSTRFTQTVDGGGAITFDSSGARLETSTTATSSVKNEWFATQQVILGSPTFSCSIEFGAIPTIGGVGFIGLGFPATFSGSGATFTGSHIGFSFQFQASEWRLYASNNNGGVEQFELLTTTSASDRFDFILKVNGSSSIDYYYRKNGGALIKTTISSGVPTSTTNKITFGMSNKGEANNIVCLVYSASYER